ncbi:outer membrane lipoprotein chaperone LolA [Xylophilus rhododendri]|uniref:Outer-membrane lipoprotein carrier protein n=1 Tax=Xylophilus rhododendri TaxID=2697032 RepID=A0A857JB44_9BURK|nr:outer membrane lipoprotein chaperone LolA [Xylophilus rhododendri]QHJ00280.1 outer membrane lipoprotein chaperone LolA [Xylophilus rhododendri]
MSSRISFLSRQGLVLAAALALSPAWADGLSSLENFMRTAKSGRADFTQVVSAPAREGETPRTKRSEGTFEFQRPGRFRFVYTKPFAQTLVADGRSLSLYDVDLQQVTVRDQAQALGSTPAAIVASSSDIKALEKDFTLAAEPDREGLQWVLATPRSKDVQLQSVRVGLRGDQLAELDILDSFGQRSVLKFSNVQANASLPASTFNFTPPAGVSVVKQ